MLARDVQNIFEARVAECNAMQCNTGSCAELNVTGYASALGTDVKWYRLAQNRLPWYRIA